MASLKGFILLKALHCIPFIGWSSSSLSLICLTIQPLEDHVVQFPWVRLLGLIPVDLVTWFCVWINSWTDFLTYSISSSVSLFFLDVMTGICKTAQWNAQWEAWVTFPPYCKGPISLGLSLECRKLVYSHIFCGLKSQPCMSFCFGISFFQYGQYLFLTPIALTVLCAEKRLNDERWGVNS